MKPRTGAAVLLAVPLFGLGIALPEPAAAQLQSLRVSGYLEHQFAVSHTDAGWGQIDYDRLRVDLDAHAGRGTVVSAAFVGQLYRGRTTTRVSAFLPASLRDELDEDPTFSIADRQYFNHAYITLNVGPATVTAGKQYLAWGRGLVFNPTELFRPKLLYDPAYEREGVGALKVTLTTGALSDVALVYVPGDRWTTSARVVRVRTHVAGFDLSGLVARLQDEDVAAALLGDPADPRSRTTLGGDLSGEVAGLGVWAEGTWSEAGNDGWVELTVGGNTTLPGEVLVNVEAFYDGRGRDGAPYPLEDWVAVAAGARRTIGRGIVFASVSRPTGDLLRLALAGLANAGDGSTALIPSAAYSFAENVDLFLQLIVPVGPEGTEFGARGAGGLIRGRVYF